MTSLVHAYETLLLSNLSAVRTLESALRNITWLLPGRFEDAELASEGRKSSMMLSHPFVLTKAAQSSLRPSQRRLGLS